MGKNLTNRYLEKKREEENLKLVRELVLQEYEKFCKKMDVSVLYAQHKTFGHGKIKLERFYREWIKIHTEMVKNYQCDGDDSHYWVMEARLKEIGVDIEALEKEVDEIE